LDIGVKANTFDIDFCRVFSKNGIYGKRLENESWTRLTGISERGFRVRVFEDAFSGFVKTEDIVRHF